MLSRVVEKVLAGYSGIVESRVTPLLKAMNSQAQTHMATERTLCQCRFTFAQYLSQWVRCYGDSVLRSPDHFKRLYMRTATGELTGREIAYGALYTIQASIYYYVAKHTSLQWFK